MRSFLFFFVVLMFSFASDVYESIHQTANNFGHVSYEEQRKDLLGASEYFTIDKAITVQHKASVSGGLASSPTYDPYGGIWACGENNYNDSDWTIDGYDKYKFFVEQGEKVDLKIVYTGGGKAGIGAVVYFVDALNYGNEIYVDWTSPTLVGADSENSVGATAILNPEKGYVAFGKNSLSIFEDEAVQRNGWIYVNVFQAPEIVDFLECTYHDSSAQDINSFKISAKYTRLNSPSVYQSAEHGSPINPTTMYHSIHHGKVLEQFFDDIIANGSVTVEDAFRVVPNEKTNNVGEKYYDEGRTKFKLFVPPGVTAKIEITSPNDIKVWGIRGGAYSVNFLNPIAIDDKNVFETDDSAVVLFTEDKNFVFDGLESNIGEWIKFSMIDATDSDPVVNVKVTYTLNDESKLRGWAGMYPMIDETGDPLEIAQLLEEKDRVSENGGITTSYVKLRDEVFASLITNFLWYNTNGDPSESKLSEKPKADGVSGFFAANTSTDYSQDHQQDRVQDQYGTVPQLPQTQSPTTGDGSFADLIGSILGNLNFKIGNFIDCSIENSGASISICSMVNSGIDSIESLANGFLSNLGFDIGGCTFRVEMKKIDLSSLKSLCNDAINTQAFESLKELKNGAGQVVSKIYPYKIAEGFRDSFSESVFTYAIDDDIKTKTKNRVTKISDAVDPYKLRSESIYDSSVALRKECMMNLGNNIDSAVLKERCWDAYYSTLPKDEKEYYDSIKKVANKAGSAIASSVSYALDIKKSYGTKKNPFEDSELSETDNKALKALQSEYETKETLINKSISTDVEFNYHGGEKISKFPAYARGEYMKLAGRDTARKTFIKSFLREMELRDEQSMRLSSFVRNVSIEPFFYYGEYENMIDFMEE